MGNVESSSRLTAALFDVLGYLQNSSLMTADTTIILEASLNEETDWVEDLGYRIRKVKKYKTNKHLFIEMDEDDE